VPAGPAALTAFPPAVFLVDHQGGEDAHPGQSPHPRSNMTAMRAKQHPSRTGPVPEAEAERPARPLRLAGQAGMRRGGLTDPGSVLELFFG